ncbi:tetratricopeptide repeat protein [Sphingomonas sp.]|uniref:tetratricopeptide repeat protein n=1 Tax=Sphingomonas sp. TaxID=28214 RepID=UPI001B10C36C|nr:tetratricopeptide repeat protein [Sphingomonas sp.]MBO9714506.1 sel1 repeat family protein [Sphingomonas sp.]
MTKAKAMLLAAAMLVPQAAGAQQLAVLDQEAAGRLEPGDARDRFGSYRDIWSFDAKPGIVYKIELRSTDFDAALELPANGAFQAPPRVYDDIFGQSNPNSMAMMVLAKPARVQIAVGTVDVPGTGAYRLTVSNAGACAQIRSPETYGCPPAPPQKAKTPAEVEQEAAALVAKAQAEAAKGNADGMTALGLYYRGVKNDQVQAAQWLERGYAAGDQRAGAELARMHSDSFYTFPGRDPARAIQIWRSLAAKGNVEAMMKLANAYRFGLDVPLDGPASLGFYQRAAQGGNVQAARLLSKVYHDNFELPEKPPEEFSASVERWKRDIETRRAKRGSPKDALYVEIDLSQSSYYLRLAGLNGDGKAAIDYAWRLHDGVGLPKSDAYALKWTRKAALRGNEEAREMLAELK